MTKLNIRTAASAAGVILAAFLCGRFVGVAANELAAQLANFIRIFLYLSLFAAWGVSVLRRVVHLQVRRYLAVVSGLECFWLTVRELRWHFVLEPAALHLLWYAYYIPILLIPLIALLVSMSLGRPESYRLPGWTRLLYLPTLLLIALVLTNDLHQLVFRFPSGPASLPELDYGYAPIYYAVFGWAVFCALAALIVMLARRRLPHSGIRLWLPAAPLLLSGLYAVLYATRVPLVIGPLGDLTVVDCLFFTSFFESCIQCGLIQSNTRYSDLFRASVGISARITDNHYAVRYTASGAEPISAEAMLRAETAPVILPGGKRLHNIPVNGGRAIWTEDISELLSLQETLKDRGEELRERNALLRLEYDREREHRIVTEQNRLYDLLQTKTQSQLDSIDRLMTDYRCAETEEQKRRILSRIVVLGSFIKRRRDFILSSDASPVIPVGKLTSALDETCRALEALDIRSGYIVRIAEDALPGETLSLAYDFFESVLEGVLDRIRYLHARVAEVCGSPRISILTDCTSDGDALKRKFPGTRIVPEDDGTEYILPLDGGAEA